MKKPILSLVLCFLCMALFAAEAPDKLTTEQAKAAAKALIKNSREIVDLFYKGLPYEDGENYKDADKFPYLPVKSDKYRSVADIKKAVEKVMTNRAAKGVFYNNFLVIYPQYKDYKGELYSCINSYYDQEIKFITWDTETLQIVSQSKGKAVVKMRVMNPPVYDEDEDDSDRFGDAYMDLAWEDGAWKLDSSPICGSMDPALRPADLKAFLEKYILKDNLNFAKPSKDAKIVYDTSKAQISFTGPEWITVECPFKETGKNTNVYSAMMDFSLEENKVELQLMADPEDIPEKYGNINPDYFVANLYSDNEIGNAAILQDYGPVSDYYWEDKSALPSFFEQIGREEFTGEFETLMDGDWSFVLIPKEKDTRIEIYQVNDNGTVGQKKKSFTGKSLILFTGKGETKANHEIRLIMPDSKIIKFRPSFNGRDGKMDLPSAVQYRKNEAAG